MNTTTQFDLDGFVHPALFYRSDEEYVQGLVPFVADGLERGEPVAAAVPGERLSLLRRALGAAAGRVHLLDMARAGRNPGRIIAGVLRAFADRHPDRHVRIIGEPIWPGRSPSEYPACVQHEALINTAFTGRHVTIVCPYDATRLEPEVLVDAEATHPLLWDAGWRGESRRYAPDAMVDRYNLPLAGSSDGVSHVATGATDLPVVRRLAVEQGRAFGLPAERIDDLELVVTELVTNSLLHADGRGELRIWPEDGHVVCQVTDAGQLADPLAGRRPAEAGQLGGRGLLLVNEVTDLVRMHTDATGTTIRAYLRRHS